jgi:hypothetical protein
VIFTITDKKTFTGVTQTLTSYVKLKAFISQKTESTRILVIISNILQFFLCLIVFEKMERQFRKSLFDFLKLEKKIATYLRLFDKIIISQSK